MSVDLTASSHELYSIDFTVQNDWGSGFQGGFSLTNNGDSVLEGWVIEFTADFEITDIWGAEILSHQGDRYTIRGMSWNLVAPGGDIAFGFIGQHSGGQINPPTDVQLNGDLTSNVPTAPVPSPELEPELIPPPAISGDNDSAMPASPQEVSVIFDVLNDWGSGFTGEIRLTNHGSTVIEGWELGFTASFDIQNAWNALESSQGNIYEFSNLSWNSTIDVGQTVTFGFSGAGTPEVSNFVLNDSPVGGDSTSGNPSTPEPPDDTSSDNPPAPEPPDDTSSDNPPAPEPPEETNSDTFNYGEVLQKSFLFFEAQRSGDLNETTKRIDWRGDSALADGADVGLDLSGGYYDAGDHVKFGLPMAHSMTMLAWGALSYTEAYDSIGQLDEVMAAIRWGTDYFLKAHVVDNGETQAFYAQVGDGHADHAYWGAPEDMAMYRPAYAVTPSNPGTEVAAETAAALAAASMLFKQQGEIDYANTLLTNAHQLYEFADTYRGKYSDSVPNAASFYNSWSGYQDELAWGASWLYEATGDIAFLQKAEANYQRGNLNAGWTLNWDDKSHGVAVKLAQQVGDDQYHQDVENWLDAWADGHSGVQITEGGLRWISQWGSLRYAANTAFVAGLYADTIHDPAGKYSDLAQTTVDYFLGNNPRGASYVVGFGENAPVNPHHRASHGGTWADFDSVIPNQNILYGALVGGPASPNDFDYEDDRTNYITNEVALDYNAAFTGALARSVSIFGGEPLTNAELNNLSGISADSTVTGA